MDAPLSARKLAITIYEHQLNPVPLRETHTSFDKLATLLAKRTLRDEKLGNRAIGPYKLHTPYRHGPNVEYFSLAVADVDDGVELKHLRSLIEPYAYVAHSSHNHITKKYDFRHKFRVIIPLSRDVSAEEWPRFWRGFSAFLQGHVDPSTKDLSRMYFLPSCPEYNVDKAFYEVHQGGMLDPDPIIASVAPELPRAPSVKLANNAFAAALETNYPDSYADIVAEHCAAIKWFKETGAPSEPLWHKFVGVLKHCVDGEEKIHEWSAQYEGYDTSETQRKIDLWEVGPPLCESIRACGGSQCNGCTQTCKTPVQLGHTEVAVKVNLTALKEDAAPAITLDKDELIRKSWNPKVSVNDNGQMTFAQTDEETGLVKHQAFSESIFYPVDLVQNEEGEWEIVVEYFTRYKKKRQFQMATSSLASSDKMAGDLAAHTVFLTGKNGRQIAMLHMKDAVLDLQFHRQEVVTEAAFGWNQEGDGFIIGNTEVGVDTVKPVRMSEQIISGGMAKDYGMEGTRNDWVRLVDEVYNRPGAEMYQFAFLVAAASPLISMVGIDGFHGIPVAYTGDGGRGKTTACELACSIWGKGELFKQSSSKGGTTVNALLARTAIFRHLPWVMDELTGQKTDEIADMLYALSNGQGKSRLTSSGSFAGKAARWDLFSFVTGNMDITGLLANLDRQMAEAVSVRCFEIKVPDDINETVFKGVNFKTLVDKELRANYGVVGRQLLKVYMKNRAKIVALIHKLRQEFNPNTADETRERFYIDLICFAVAAGRVMAKLDLIRFDVEGVRRWAMKNIKSLRAARTERQMTINDVIGDFISYLHNYTIVTKTVADMRRGGKAEMPLDMLRGDPLARKAVDDKKFYVAARAFQDWGKENGVSPSVVRDALDKQGYVLRTSGRTDPSGAFNFRLGQGTTRTTGLARCFELDYAKMHGHDVVEVTGGNVVPIGRDSVTNVITGGLETALSA